MTLSKLFSLLKSLSWGRRLEHEMTMASFIAAVILTLVVDDLVAHGGFSGPVLVKIVATAVTLSLFYAAIKVTDDDRRNFSAATWVTYALEFLYRLKQRISALATKFLSIFVAKKSSPRPYLHKHFNQHQHLSLLLPIPDCWPNGCYLPTLYEAA